MNLRAWGLAALCVLLAISELTAADEAATWYRKAASQKLAGAQNSLGGMYLFGEGVPKDPVEAYKWFSLAAAQGDTNALNGQKLVAKSLSAQQLSEAKRLVAVLTEKKPATPATNKPPSR